MEIQEIKQRLTMAQILAKYGLKPDKHMRMNCPFHEDKTPSMQVYYKTHTAYCFSSNCPTHGKSLDVIDFIMYQEKCNKHEAILKAQDFIGLPNSTTPQPKPTPKPDKPEPNPTERAAFLNKMFTYFKNAVYNSKPAQDYLQSRKLDFARIEVGYNSGQFHHGTRKDETLIQQCLEVGLLSESAYPARTGEPAYSVFGKWCIVFALRNKQNQVTGLYFRSTLNDKEQRHFYLKERSGLYPGYPKPETKRLILTEAIIDTASLLQIPEITINYELLSCFGTNGLTEEHKEAIKELKQLKEIVLFYDGDGAGKEAIQKHSELLHQLRPGIKLSYIETPENEDINSLWQGHEPELFTHLLKSRIELFFSTEKKVNENPVEKEKSINNQPTINTNPSFLDTTNPEQIIYESETLKITIWGGIEKENLSRLKVSLHIKNKADKYKSFRDDVNLYSHGSMQKLVQNIAETLELSTSLVIKTLTDLTEKLEEYRLQERTEHVKALQPKLYEMSEAEKAEATAILKDKNIIQNTMQSIEKSGLVGEQKNGLLLFLLYLSRFFDEPLHAIIFGKSGSGKTYLQTKVSDCLPEESVRTITSLTENTLYYSVKDFWKHKVLLIEDLEGVYNAFLPLREFMSKQSITKLTTDKDAKGNNVQKILTVEGPVCVSGATTMEGIYEDNANRSYLLHVDESSDHLSEVLQFQRQQQAGLINETAQNSAKLVLKNSQRLLKPVKVINHYATDLVIPDCVFKKLRTNMHYLRLIEIITFYHQQQRQWKKNPNNEYYIETSLTDIEWANYLVKDTLLRKSDELNGETRQFFESLKNLVRKDNPKQCTFYAKDIRHTFRMHPMKLTRFLSQLESRNLLKRVSSRQSGYEYEITSFEDYELLKHGVNILDRVLEQLKAKYDGKNGKTVELHTSFTSASQNGVQVQNIN
jgi:DNA primase catalytic core